jgi:hypothetical protein
VLVILILQITNKQTKAIELSTEIPKSTTLMIRCDQNSFNKKFLLSILYDPNKNNSLRQLYKKIGDTGDQSPGSFDKYLEVFLSNIDPQKPLEIISINKNEEDLIFLRQRNNTPLSKEHLHRANGYLYLQLNHLDWNKDEIKLLLGEHIKVKIPKSLTRDIQFYQLNNETLSLAGNINTSSQGISIHLPNRKSAKTRDKLKPDGLHVSISNQENLLPFLKDRKANNSITSLSINYFGLNIYDSPLFFPNADFLFEFENEITTNDFINYFGSEFFINPYIVYVGDSINQEAGTLNVDDIAFNYKKTSPNHIYLGSTSRTLQIEKTNQPIELSGDLSQVFNFDENGWKGRLAKELITSVPLLNQLNIMLKNTKPLTTSDDNEGSKIDINFKQETSTYIELMNLLSAGI